MTDFFDPSNPLSPLSPLNPSNPASPLSPLNPSNPASPLYDDDSSNSTTDRYKKSHRKNSGSMNKPPRQAGQTGKTLVSWTGIATFLLKTGFSISLVRIRFNVYPHAFVSALWVGLIRRFGNEDICLIPVRRNFSSSCRRCHFYME